MTFGRLSLTVPYQRTISGVQWLLVLFMALIIGPVTRADETDGPQVSALSALILDDATGQVLWSKDPDTRRYPASTTKILTALLLIEHTKPDDMITAPEGVDRVEGASLYLKPGEQVSARDMLYALMLRSANDACVAVAHHISGSVEKFSELMNERAKAIGAKHSTFNNPHGLNDDIHMTTAYDLALIAREAMRYPEFREVAKTSRHTIERSINTQDRLLISKNRWLQKDETADGIKTGWTVPAGRCYVGSATRNGMRVITVILKSEDWQADHEAMLNWAFANYRQIRLNDEASSFAPPKVRVEGGESPTVTTLLGESILYTQRVGTSNLPVALTNDNFSVTAPVRAGDVVGNVTLVDAAGWRYEVPLIADHDVPAARPFLLQSGFLWAGGATLIIGSTLWYSRRQSRLRRSKWATSR